jgi:hypothetical protein
MRSNENVSIVGQTDTILSLADDTRGPSSGWRMPAQNSATTEDASTDVVADGMMKKMDKEH